MFCRLPLAACSFSLASFLAVTSAVAGPSCGHCPTCEVEYVECTVLVPQTISQTRMYKQTLLRAEPREETVTTYKYEPATREVSRRKLVVVPEKRRRTEVYYECVPVTREIVQTCRVKVPYLKEITREYLVCGEVRTCVDRVPACRIEEREIRKEVTEYQTVRRTRDVEYVHLTAKTEITREEVEVLKCVPVETTQERTVMVSYVAERPVEVRRCVMVPTKIQVPICRCCGCKLDIEH